MDCLFCKIISGEIKSNKIHEDELTYAFLDIFPVTKGHALVIPKNHAQHLEELDDDSISAILITAKKVSERLRNTLNYPATTIGINNGTEAGQEIGHVHIHIIPRYNDTGTLWLKRKILRDNELDELAQKIRNCIE